MSNDDDLGIRSDEPFIGRLENGLGILLGILGLEIFKYVYVILLILIISSGIFSQVDGFWPKVLIFIGLYVVVTIWGLIKQSLVDSWLSTIFFGKPIFGRLGGPPRSIFFTGLKASEAIEIELGDDDAEKMSGFINLTTELEEESLKLVYLNQVYNPNEVPIDEEEFEEQWSQIWEDQILELRTGNLTYRDALDKTNFAYSLASGNMALMAPLMDRLLLVFMIVILYLAARVLNGRMDSFLVVQIGVFLSFILSIVWYIAYSFQSGTIQLFVNLDQISDDLQSKFAKSLLAYEGTVIHPMRLMLKKKFFALMRGFQSRFILSSLTYTIGGLFLVGAIMVGLRIWSIMNMTEWYQYMAITLLIIPFFFLLGFYIISLILEYSKQVVAPIVAGLVGAALPFAIEFIATGELPLDDLNNALSSVISGIGILLATTLATLLRKRMEGEN